MFRFEDPLKDNPEDPPSKDFVDEVKKEKSALPEAYRSLQSTLGLQILLVKKLCGYCPLPEEDEDGEPPCLENMGYHSHAYEGDVHSIRAELDYLASRDFRQIAKDLVIRRDNKPVYPLIMIPEYTCQAQEDGRLPCAYPACEIMHVKYWKKQDTLPVIFRHEFWHFIDSSVENMISACPAFIKALSEDLKKEETRQLVLSDPEAQEDFMGFASEVFADAGAVVCLPESHENRHVYECLFPSSVAWVEEFDRGFQRALRSQEPTVIQKFLECALG